MRERIDELKARKDQPRYKYADKEQAKVIAHFIDRGIQWGEAAFRIRDLQIPLDSIMRILSDDLIRLFWVSESEENTAEYVRTIGSEWVKMMRANLEKGAMLVSYTSPQDKMPPPSFFRNWHPMCLRESPLNRSQCNADSDRFTKCHFASAHCPSTGTRFHCVAQLRN